MERNKQKKQPLPKEVVKEKLREKKKVSKQLLKSKRARLVVSNLPFKAKEEDLKKYFEKYGEVESVTLLMKPDGKLVGCCFVQFKLVQKAAKARHHTNGKEYLGRKIVVEFAKPKNKYQKEVVEKSKVSEIKEENDDDVKDNSNEIKEEIIEVKDVSVVDEEMKAEDSDDDATDADSDNESEDNSEGEEMEVNEQPENKPRVMSNDITEGKTVFVKNVPFDATNDDLKECMKQFGRIFYALICVDRYTDHSKGTAFVKFVEKEDADKALNAGTELTLLGNILDCHPALDRNAIQQKATNKSEAKKDSKDSRNLYLVKEGVILAGSKAAQGVSASDMAKRLQIEQYKTQMLRNLNMFVAKDRLVIYNLPASWDDKKLRILMQKYGGPGAVVREARIMRDMRDLDAKGVGKSKEYGFVSYTKHDNALHALRSLNNNPDIFSPQKRPIVTFSIENKVMVKAKLKRLEKSRTKNPTSKTYQKPKADGTAKLDNNRNDENNSKRKRLNNKWNNRTKLSTDMDHNSQEFSGVSTEPGDVPKMRSRQKLAAQAKLHYENLKKEKRKRKNLKKPLSEKKKEFIKQPKQKINKIKERDEFAKLVNSYKKTLLSAPVEKKSKWYES